MENILFDVNGIMSRPKSIIRIVDREVYKGVVLTLECEPDNKYDAHAVKVLYDNKMIGYVERDLSEEVSLIVNSDNEYECNVLSCFSNTKTDYTDSGREIEVIKSIDLIAELKII